MSDHLYLISKYKDNNIIGGKHLILTQDEFKNIWKCVQNIAGNYEQIATTDAQKLSDKLRELVF